MGSEDDEQRMLRSVALQNAKSILVEGQRVERELVEERERLRITLASIGDGVITTDPEGRVVFLNAVAEKLTGWSQPEAAGQPLSAVFQIVNEETRQPVDNPALRALQEGRVVDLANHTVLIARDGSERPIDDSAAPMRSGTLATIGAVLVFRDVTARRRAEEARLQLAAIVQSSDDAILSKTLDGVIRSWNPGAERIFGYTPEEAIGQNITLLIPPDRHDEEVHILNQLQKGQRIEHFETVRVAKDGRRLDISLTVSPLKDQDGRVIGASKIGRDITDRKRAEEALRESEGRHRFLVDLAAATQRLTDADEVMSRTATILAEHLGVDRCAYAEVEDEVTFVITGDYSRDVPSIVGRWPVPAFGAECQRCMLANEAYVIDDIDSDDRAGPDLEAYRQTQIQAVICTPIHKAGKFVAAMAVHQKHARRWMPAEIELVRNVVGRSWESIERARVARGLKQAADRLALAVTAANLGDWSWDAVTDVVTLSPRAASIFGIPPGPQQTWASIQGLLHEEDRARAKSAVERAVTERSQYDIEYRVVRGGGEEVWVSAKGRAQYQPNGTALGMFGVVQDITERKQLERDLRQRALELSEADRKKNDFIALLAHELRNPLAPVRTGLQVLRIAATDADKVAKTWAMMDRQLSHMVRLIDDLLDVSRISRNRLHLQKTRVLLEDVVSHALEAVGPAVDAGGHELIVSLPPEPITLNADLTRLAQVLGNLLTNSVKYTERGGRIWLSAERQGDQLELSVKDTGIGIPSEALPQVFDMFSQVDRAVERLGGGLGIGLALVKGLVESHGGTVWAESPGPGRGSTFRVRLPIAERTVVLASSDATGNLRMEKPRRCVLVADDNQDAAESLAELLELLGNEVHLAGDGVSAVAMAERVRPDLVLMDVGMPRLNGLDAARQIRERSWGREITILALTGWGQAADRERSRAAGCDGHLVKPIAIPQLEKILAELPKRESGALGSDELGKRV